MDDIFDVGDIVLSTMGRDSGRHYIVVEAEENPGNCVLCGADMVEKQI